jgi:hypothetical protein
VPEGLGTLEDGDIPGGEVKGKTMATVPATHELLRKVFGMPDGCRITGIEYVPRSDSFLIHVDTNGDQDFTAFGQKAEALFVQQGQELPWVMRPLDSWVMDLPPFETGEAAPAMTDLEQALTSGAARTHDPLKWPKETEG